MNVSPIGALGSGSACCNIYETSRTKKSTDIFSIISGNDSSNIFETIAKGRIEYDLSDQVEFNPAWINIYLQYPNEIIKEIALKIVNEWDSNDVKMEKIQRAVVRGIGYQTDAKQYGYEELWVPALQTIQSGKGDCEDGAFLIMSLALNAGVSSDRLRMYGGIVDTGPGAASGGHGWVSYRREKDNEWVAIDFSYYPDLSPMNSRIPLKDDERYIDDYFYMTNQYIVSTPFNNRIRNPDGLIYDKRATLPNIFSPGSIFSKFI